MTERPFAALLATEGVREVSELRGRIGFMAFHGGGLEEMTDVIAAAAAERSDASYYGVLQPNHLDWHIPSHRVSPAESPRLAAFLDHVDVVVTIHGFGRAGLFTSLLLGGQNREMATHVGHHLRARLPAYDVRTDIDTIPRDLRGLHHANPVNLAEQRGVQIELAPTRPRVEPAVGRLGGPRADPAHRGAHRRPRRRGAHLAQGASRSMTQASASRR